MNTETIKTLKEIKEKHPPGGAEVQGNDWKKYRPALVAAGEQIIQDIEEIRNEICAIRIHLFYFMDGAAIKKLNGSYNQIYGHFSLFFDATMRLSRSIFVEGVSGGPQIKCLLDHSSKSMDNLSSLVSRKFGAYRHCQTLFVALVAVIIALISIVISR